MKLSAEQLKDLLVSPGHVSKEAFETATREAENKKIPLARYLVERGTIPDEYLGRIVADEFDYHFVDLKRYDIGEELLGTIPEIVAQAQEAIIFERDGSTLKLATTEPENYEFIKLLEKKTGLTVEVFYATPFGVQEGLKHYKSDLGVRVRELLHALEEGKEIDSEEAVVLLVNLFLEYAYTNQASDIHIEPLTKEVSVRYRIDGILHEVVSYPKRLHEKVVFRLKIMSRLRTDEHAAAQDGRFDYDANNTQFDVRVSILPVTNGENIVMRLLSDKLRRFSLEELGLSGNDLKIVEDAAKKPYGMILSVGPTGSGKTTSLYAILQILNNPEVNIMTIEDPTEYDVEHVQQIQVNPKKNLTFATGLRSVVRQDPDIIMVGEIRDEETAEIAINAAMTGHLLLSTLHANDAGTTFPRLIDMGVEPFLVASSVNVVMAQRLVRRICERCRASYTLSENELALLRSDEAISRTLEKISGKAEFDKMTFYKGAGCNVCGHTGYSGRNGVFEVLPVTDEIRALIAAKETADVITKKARELGMGSMLEDGIMKVFQGLTTIEEVVRAVKG